MNICLKNISKRFGERNIFKNYNLLINDREMVALTGKSGAGKSTLLNIIGLLESVDNGDVLFDNAIVKSNSKQSMLLLRYKLGYLYQNYALVDNEDVNYNLAISQRFCKEDRSRKDSMKKEALRTVGLNGDIINEKIFNLSGGEQQRVALARLILKPCEIILADEPTGSLDKTNAKIVFDVLRKLNNQGKIIIIATHDDGVKAICNRIINIADN